ncbi:MAG: extensin family protein [Rhodobacteraceae bacterium]|nr:extensin family protein [Paracoccaceae bacterium]
MRPASERVTTLPPAIVSLRPVLRKPVRGAAVPAPAAQTQPVVLPPKVAVKRPNDRSRSTGFLNGLFRKRTPEKGRTCGIRGVEGVDIGRVPGRLPGCGVEAAVKVSAMGGVAFSTPAVMDCGTAGAIHEWLETSAKPAFQRKGGGLSQIRVAAHYACRTRNNQRGARISEHGKGRAIDISAFTMKDGTTITVLKGWRDPKHRRALRTVHKDACGPFGTVLGPNADRFHQDHFHFDTARYRSGPYCR